MSIEKSKRMSFSDLVAQEDNALYNSNMLNLVSAARAIEKELRMIEKRKTFLTNHLTKINLFASGPEEDILDTTKIKELFDAQKNFNPKDDRW